MILASGEAGDLLGLRHVPWTALAGVPCSKWVPPASFCTCRCGLTRLVCGRQAVCVWCGVCVPSPATRGSGRGWEAVSGSTKVIALDK